MSPSEVPGIRELEGRLADQSRELTAARAELASARAELGEAEAARATFLAKMSHELRTPMNAIIGYAEMLREEATDEGLDGWTTDIDSILTAAHGLLELIDDVLDVSRIDAGRMDLTAEEFDLADEVREVAALFEQMADERDNTLHTLLEGPVPLRSDRMKIRQVLVNLTSNALKFTHGGEITIEARLIEGSDPSTAVMVVEDNGEGIPADRQAGIFGEFVQVDDSSTRREGGTGLGLALTHRLVDMLGGSVSVVSHEGRGSRFTVELPVLLAPRERAADQPVSVDPGDGDLVMVIDDDPVACDILSRILRGEGLRVAIAHTAAEGLSAARNLGPALITLDAMLPGMDGWTALQRLKADPATAAIPVVMISVTPDRNLATSLGAVESLAKPVDRSSLQALAHRYAGEDRTVLVVDDDPVARQVMRSALEHDGLTVQEAGDGAEALGLLGRNRPALIVLDLTMPVMDGFEFLAALDSEHRNIPVVVVTGTELDADQRRRLQAAVTDVVHKADGVREVVERHVRSLLIPGPGRTEGIGSSTSRPGEGAR